MNKFVVYQTLKLDFLGEGWEEAYLKFNAVPYADTETLQKDYGLEGVTPESIKNDPELQKKSAGFARKFLSKYYIEGKGFDGKTLIPIEKDELPLLPAIAILTAVTFLNKTESENPNS